MQVYENTSRKSVSTINKLFSGKNLPAVREHIKANMQTEKKIIGTLGREIRILVRRMTSLYNSMEILDRSAVLLLAELQSQGPLGISMLATNLQLDISTASRQTAALEAKGLVERLSDPEDGR